MNPALAETARRETDGAMVLPLCLTTVDWRRSLLSRIWRPRETRQVGDQDV